jgi:hypothetical protein
MPMDLLSPTELADALVAAGISGLHQSHSRHNNISSLKACVEGDPDKSFGMTGLTLHSPQEALDALAELTGCSNDLGDISGHDTMDPIKTVAGVVAAARVLADHARRGSTLLACTGHPTGMLELYMRIVDAYRAAGGKVIRPREEERLHGIRKGYAEVRYIGNVGLLADWGQLMHTHGSEAMEALLEADPLPDLVLGDHGFAGAAIERGIPTVAIMDINDPALAIAWLEGKDVSIVPLDDNRPPALYEPLEHLFVAIISGTELPEGYENLL